MNKNLRNAALNVSIGLIWSISAIIEAFSDSWGWVILYFLLATVFFMLSISDFIKYKGLNEKDEN